MSIRATAGLSVQGDVADLLLTATDVDLFTSTGAEAHNRVRSASGKRRSEQSVIAVMRDGLQGLRNAHECSCALFGLTTFPSPCVAAVAGEK